jgi:RNA-directed DNA polymerase
MLEAYRTTRKDGATGIDGVTAADYAESLEVNLLDLLDRIKSGRYRAPPVRRTYIPKADGSQRPLGIPTFEDKVAQRAIVMLLEAIYEQDFLPCSYGFRPGRSAHDALYDLRTAFMTRGVRWVLDIDIRRYSTPYRMISFGAFSTSGSLRCGPADDRQMAEGRGPGRRLPVPRE